MDIFSNQIVQEIFTQGIWAGLFILLLIFILKKNETREKKYDEVLESQSKLLVEISQNIDSINQRFDELELDL